MIRRLWFVDANKNKTFIIQNADDAVLTAARIADMKKRHIKPAPYLRGWIDDQGEWIDFGSWSEFYLIDEVDPTKY